MTVFALYVSTARYGVNGITLHRTVDEAYAQLVDYLKVDGDTHRNPVHDPVPAELDDLIAWCEERADAQGTEFYCTEVAVPEVTP